MLLVEINCLLFKICARKSYNLDLDFVVFYNGYCVSVERFCAELKTKRSRDEGITSHI